jgi:hypothetical protein
MNKGNEAPADPRFQQIGGLVVAVAKVIELLKSKGTVTEFEVDAVLEAAEAAPLSTFAETAQGDEFRNEMLFPIRMLRVSNRTWPTGAVPSPAVIRDFLEGRTHEL